MINIAPRIHFVAVILRLYSKLNMISGAIA